MAKRWIIRSLFLLPVLLCLAGWGWSGWYGVMARYTRSPLHIDLGTGDGAVSLGSVFNPWWPDGYDTRVNCNKSVRLWPEPRADATSCLGFRLYLRYSEPDGPVRTGWFLIIPYWFPLVVSSLLLLLVWRKTRYRPDPATAFPVVLKA